MSVKLTKNPSGTWLLEGALNELADYGPLIQEPAEALVMDLRGVRSITSHGLRVWTQFMEAVPHKSVQLHACPAIFLDAIDVLPQMLPARDGIKALRSCSIEYFCEHCEKDMAFEIDRKKMTPDNAMRLIEEMACPRCRLPLTTDDNVQIYCELLTD